MKIYSKELHREENLKKITSTRITRNPKNGFILSLKEWFKKNLCRE